MKISKKLSLIILWITLALTLTACKKRQEEPETLRIGVMYSADIIPLGVMKEQGLDKKQGFILDMQVFTSAADRDAALQAGELDGVFTDYIGMCIYQNAGIDVKITGVTDGDYRLAAGGNAGIEKLEQCEGRSIAISENTLIEYTLDYLLEKEGYPSDYVHKEIVPKITERVELLRAGSVDLGLLPDPFGTLAEIDGAVVLGSANEAGLYPAVSAFLQSAIDKRKDEIKAFYNAYNEACSYINETPVEELEDIIIRDAGFPESLKGKITLPTYRMNTLPSLDDLKRAIDWSSNRGLCDSSLTPEDLLGRL